MRIERIGENIIKVTISMADLEERNIDIDSINYDSDAAQELFWDMVEQAEIELDFEIANSQLLIEPYPDEDEGFIITITRLDNDGEFESIQKYIKNKFQRTDAKVRRGKRLSPAVWIYRFEDFEHLCQLAAKLEHIYKGDSSLYSLKGHYYLVLRKDGFLALDTIMTANLLAEYGHRMHNVSFTEGYLNEYGTLLIRKNCLETIRNYF